MTEVKRVHSQSLGSDCHASQATPARWFTTAEIFKAEPRCSFSGMPKSSCFDCNTVGERWLSSSGAGALANQLEEAIAVYEQGGSLTAKLLIMREKIKPVVRVLRGEDK